MAISNHPSGFSNPGQPNSQWDLHTRRKDGNPFAVTSGVTFGGTSSSQDDSKAGRHMTGFVAGLNPEFNLSRPAPPSNVSFIASA
jgi:hypothetical protein